MTKANGQSFRWIWPTYLLAVPRCHPGRQSDFGAQPYARSLELQIRGIIRLHIPKAATACELRMYMRCVQACMCACMRAPKCEHTCAIKCTIGG